MATRSSTGVKWPVALLGFVCALVLLAWQRLDLGYLFASRTPVVLGREGEYRFDALANNRYVQIHGVPTARGAYSREGGQVDVTVGLRDTPVLVHRGAIGREAEWKSGTVPPQPDPRPFAVGGRLLRDDSATRYEAAFALLRKTGEVIPWDGHLWIVLEGERPGSDVKTALIAAGLAIFAVVNGWFFVRGVRERIGQRKAARAARA